MLSRCFESRALVCKYVQATDDEISLEVVDRYGKSREQKETGALGRHSIVDQLLQLQFMLYSGI